MMPMIETLDVNAVNTDIINQIEEIQAAITTNINLQHDNAMKVYLLALLKTAHEQITKHGFKHPNRDDGYSDYKGFTLKNPQGLSAALTQLHQAVLKFGNQSTATPGVTASENPYEALRDGIAALEQGFSYHATPEYLRKKKLKIVFGSIALSLFLLGVAAGAVALCVFFIPAAMLITSFTFSLLAGFGLLVVGSLGVASLSIPPMTIAGFVSDFKKLKTKVSPNNAISRNLSHLKNLVSKDAAITKQYNDTSDDIIRAIRANRDHKSDLIVAEINSTKEDISMLTTSINTLLNTLNDKEDELCQALTRINNELNRIQYTGERLMVYFGKNAHSADELQLIESQLNQLLREKTLDTRENTTLTQAVFSASHLLAEHNLIPIMRSTRTLLERKGRLLNEKHRSLLSSTYETDKLDKYRRTRKTDAFEKNKNRFNERLLNNNSTKRADAFKIKDNTYFIFTQHSKSVTNALHKLAVENEQITPDFLATRLQGKKTRS